MKSFMPEFFYRINRKKSVQTFHSASISPIWNKHRNQFQIQVPYRYKNFRKIFFAMQNNLSMVGNNKKVNRQTVANNYWSSSTNVNNTNNAWNVNFNNGNVNNNDKTNNNYVRCVRGE